MRGTTTTAAALLDAWQWEIPNHPPAMLTADEEAILDATIEEVQRSPASCAVAHGGRTAVWRYLEAARWQPEVSGKPVSTYFLETLEWRESLGVDSILDCDENTTNSLLPETRSGGMFVRGTCLLGRSLIWIHLGRKRVEEPESNLRFLIYTVERAIACMGPESLGPEAKGQFVVLIDCTYAGAGSLPSLQFARQAISMLMMRYPSRLGQLLLVNAGMAVNFLWQAVSLLLSPVTRQKIVVVTGTDQQRHEVLVKYISTEALQAGRLGCPGEPSFDAEGYLAGGDGVGVQTSAGGPNA